MKKLKSRLADICKSTLSMIKKLLDLTIKYTVTVALVAGFMLLAVRAPELHGRLIRSNVGNKVYLITNDLHRGSGTGFAIKAPSGQSYIVTNDHVCKASNDKENLVIIDRDGNEMRRRIIIQSDFTDLCLIEGLPGVEGLSVGSEPEIGQIIAAIGHPSGYDLTLTRGEIIQKQDVLMAEAPISFFGENGQEVLISPEEGGIAEANCKKPKNLIDVAETNFGFFTMKIKWCLIKTKKAYYTNMVIQPGSSGSPIVNFWGNVIGVVFAGDRAMWGITVSYKDLTKFLRNY